MATIVSIHKYWMQTPRKLIRIVNTTRYRGPTTMEELREQTFKMVVKPDHLSNNGSIQGANKITYDKDMVLHLIGEGLSNDEIAEKVGIHASTVSRVRSGKR